MKYITTIFLCLFLFSCGAKTIEVKKSIDSPFYGDKNSKVQIKIYTDLECPACIFFEESIGKYLLNDYALKNKIGLTYKMFPLSNIHKNAKDDAIGALCATKQGKYKEFAEEMYSLEKERGGETVTAEDRLKIAKDIRLNELEFTTCVKENHYLNKIESDIKDGETDKITGTPSIFINGTLLDLAGVKSKDEVFKLIDNLIK